MPESPFEWELLNALLSLPGRRTLLLPGGETSGLLSRSVWVAGLFPVCFLFLATMVSRKSRRSAAGSRGEKPEGVCELSSPTVARIWSSDLPLYYLSDACTGSSLQTLGEIWSGSAPCWTSGATTKSFWRSPWQRWVAGTTQCCCCCCYSFSSSFFDFVCLLFFIYLFSTSLFCFLFVCMFVIVGFIYLLIFH